MAPVAEGNALLHTRIEALFATHVEAVFNVAYRVVWNRADAEDVVQSTFLKAFTRLDQLQEPSRVRPWLLQIAYRQAITVIRRRRETPTDPEVFPEATATALGPEDTTVLSELAAELSKALHSLDADERMAVVLRDVEQLPMREVAEILDIGLSAAKMRVHRGRQSLRVKLEARGVR